MDLSSSSAKKGESSSEKHINDLADSDLAAIFKQLPPYDRLIASEVCRRWHGLSRKAWLDVTKVDLSPIPEKHIGAIVSQCPNLRSVFALKESFDLNELTCLARVNQLSNIKFYDCSFAIKTDGSVCMDGFAQIFSENTQHASWDELILHEAYLYDNLDHNYLEPNLAFSAAYFPASLTRLQLSGLHFECCPKLFLDALDRLQNLECFILLSTTSTIDSACCDFIFRCFLCRPNPSALQTIGALKKLRELCIGPVDYICYDQPILGRLTSSLPNLEVLFLYHFDVVANEEDLKELMAENSVLRILVLTGWLCPLDAAPVNIPARKRFPHGFGSDPLPLLHVFVGKEASEKILFENSSSDAAAIYSINEPMPEFLEREDIAPLFKGIWVAEKIKETAKCGGKLWQYESDNNYST